MQSSASGETVDITLNPKGRIVFAIEMDHLAAYLGHEVIRVDMAEHTLIRGYVNGGPKPAWQLRVALEI